MNDHPLIERFGLLPHPEGGWYRELHRSPLRVRRPDGDERAGLTAILFLLQAGEVSRWHRVTGADETWHFAGGDPLELLVLPAEDGPIQRHGLGPVTLLQAPDQAGRPAHQQPLAVVPAGCWQAARSLGAWSLVSCCVGPGFDFSDFSLLRDLPREQWPPQALKGFL